MDIILYLSKYNSAFHVHNEQFFTNDSFNSRKFLGLSRLLSNYHPLLSAHLPSIENSNKSKRLTFMSKYSQNVMLKALRETITEDILKEVKSAGMFSVIIDTTTDISKLDQFGFVLRYC